MTDERGRNLLYELQRRVAELHVRRGYNNTPQTLLLGAMEELGEVAQAVLLMECDDYIPSSPNKLTVIHEAHSVAREVGDVITYLLGLCNKLGIEPHFHWMAYGDKEVADAC